MFQRHPARRCASVRRSVAGLLPGTVAWWVPCVRGQQPAAYLGSLLILQTALSMRPLFCVMRQKSFPPAFSAIRNSVERSLATVKLQDARVENEIAVQLRPADPALHYELGLLYQRSGDKAAAK